MKWFKEIVYFVVYWFLRFSISLRYHIKIEGLDAIVRKNPESGFLFLPNHPAEVDPIFLLVMLWRNYRARPLVIQYFFEMPMIQPFMRLVRALATPNMNGSSNKWKVHQIEKLFSTIVEGLKKKENIIIYPAGRLKLEEEEVVGGASLVHSLLQEFPEVNIVLVRTTGLWGSSFSRALTGKVPPFGKKLLEGFINLFKNGIFFQPRRDVTMEFEMAPSDLPIKGGRLELNQYLEKWFNKKKDPLKLVSYTFWKETLPKVSVTKEGQLIYVKQRVPKKVKEDVISMLKALSHRQEKDIKDDFDLWTDLGLDSLDLAKVHAFLDDNYDIVDLGPEELQSVEDVLQAAVGRKKLVDVLDREKRMVKWPKELPRKSIEMPKGETLQEVFLRSCDRMGKRTACSDGLMDVCLSYRRLKTLALALSMEMKKLPGKYVGVMLPSSVAAYICILAVLFAKKVPVMLNWTVGSRALDHAADITKLSCVLSARRFLEKVDRIDLGSIEEKLLFLEDFRKRLTLGEKIKAFLLSRKKTSSVMHALDLNAIDKESQAVLLFTSGTEALPKGVPLTHHNLLSNQRGALCFLEARKNDILLAVLPPFHSFGFSVTGLLPLLIGIKVCFAADPTDGRQMAADVEHWKVTILCCAPSFLQGMFHVAKKEQLKTVRLVVSGAEKAPQELFDVVSSLPRHPELLEGYGITECSPIVTINRLHAPPCGIMGKPIHGVELCVIDQETEEVLPPQTDGEICIAGPGVFLGYLGIKKNPFIEIENKQWYRSGDRGHIDSDGNLILTGRLKRFIKMGAEMVGLGGIEEDITKISIEKRWISASSDKPQIVVHAQEKEGEKPRIIVYTTADLDRDRVNEALREEGMSRLVKVSEVKKIDEIPISGTGKIQYRKLGIVKQ